MNALSYRIEENTKVHLGMAYDKDATTLLILVSMEGGLSLPRIRLLYVQIMAFTFVNKKTNVLERFIN